MQDVCPRDRIGSELISTHDSMWLFDIRGMLCLSVIGWGVERKEGLKNPPSISRSNRVNTNQPRFASTGVVLRFNRWVQMQDVCPKIGLKREGMLDLAREQTNVSKWLLALYICIVVRRGGNIITHALLQGVPNRTGADNSVHVRVHRLRTAHSTTDTPRNFAAKCLGKGCPSTTVAATTPCCSSP